VTLHKCVSLSGESHPVMAFWLIWGIPDGHITMCSCCLVVHKVEASNGCFLIWCLIRKFPKSSIIQFLIIFWKHSKCQIALEAKFHKLDLNIEIPDVLISTRIQTIIFLFNMSYQIWICYLICSKMLKQHYRNYRQVLPIFLFFSEALYVSNSSFWHYKQLYHWADRASLYWSLRRCLSFYKSCSQITL